MKFSKNNIQYDNNYMLYEYSDNKLGDKDGVRPQQQSDHFLKPWLSNSFGNL